MTRRTLELAAFCVALLIAALALHAWLASRADQQRLATTLASQNKIIDAADASQRAAQSSLAAALAQIGQLKRATQTPDQIIAALPKYLQLPQPIALPHSGAPEKGTAAPETRAAPSPAHGGATPGLAGQGFGPDAKDRAQRLSDAQTRSQQGVTPNGALSCDPASPDCVAQIPAADLKPLFDYVQDCRACQAELAAAKQSAADDAAKIAALQRERDAAATAAKGGTFWRRLRRNAMWFAVGAAAGYAAHR